MKNKVLIIFKYPREHWNQPVINKFSNFYATEYLYISDYKNKNFTEIVNEINSLIKLKNIEKLRLFLNFVYLNKLSNQIILGIDNCRQLQKIVNIK